MLRKKLEKFLNFLSQYFFIIRKIFSLFLVGIVLWWIGSAGYALYNYYRFSSSAEAFNLQWSLKEAENGVGIGALFSYEADGEQFQGETFFASQIQRNSWAAKNVQDEMAAQKWMVWYDPSKPFDSTLAKEFPFKTLFNAFIVCGLWGYYLIRSKIGVQP